MTSPFNANEMAAFDAAAARQVRNDEAKATSDWAARLCGMPPAPTPVEEKTDDATPQL